MKIAVIGGGISGIASALILKQQHEVHLFEKDARLGGHAHTVQVAEGDHSFGVDTGFLVYNTLTYPHFTRFLEHLGVETADSDMSLSIMTPNGVEWAGTNLRAVFAQKRNILNWRFLSMLKDIVKFHKEADENLTLARRFSWTLSDMIAYRRMGKGFLSWYLLPMTGAIWSMSYSQALSFPAETFLTFCLNHRLLQVNDRPQWRTVKGGSKNYVDRAAAKIGNIHLNSSVESICKSETGVRLRVNGDSLDFDKVVFATHAPITRAILAENFPKLSDILSPLRTTPNEVFLHRDVSVMPKRSLCWSSWNVKARENAGSSEDIVLSYYLNKLQPLPTRNNYFITLNSEPRGEDIERSFSYAHPQFDREAIRLQELLPTLQGEQGIYFAGAWTRYGFHEDGILSAVNVAKKIGCEPPWT